MRNINVGIIINSLKDLFTEAENRNTLNVGGKRCKNNIKD